jgi:virginiamycin B lyase
MDARYVATRSPRLAESTPRSRGARSTVVRRIALALVALALATLALAARADADIYWTNEASIGHANADGSGVNQNFITGFWGPADRGPLRDCGRPLLHPLDERIRPWHDGRAKVDGTSVNNSWIPGVSGANDLGMALGGKYIYWADVVTQAGINFETIGRANLAGARQANQAFITLPGVNATHGVAVDSAHVYWARGEGTIGRANLDGTGLDNSFIPTGGSTYGLAVNATHIFWANLEGTIGRANLDGSASTRALSPAPLSPTG